MPDYICTKCQLGVRTRSIFTDDNESATLSNLIKIKTEEKPNGLRQVVLTFPYLESGSETKKRPTESLELEAMQMLQGISPKTLKHLVCEHTWV